MPIKQPVLILFGDNIVGYNALSSLNHKESVGVGLIPKGSLKPWLWSRFYKNFQFSKYKWNDPRYFSELIEYLDSFQSGESSILTLLTNDNAVGFWCKHESSLKKYCTVNEDCLFELYDKWKFSQKLNDLSLSPKTWNKVGDVEHYPVVVKPSTKDSAYSFMEELGQKALIAEDEDQLTQCLLKVQGDLILQEYIPFTESDDYSVWCYRSRDGKLESLVAHHQKKYPNSQGRVTHIRLVENAELIECASRVLTHLNYYGICDLQFVYDQKNKKYRLLEMNPRLWCSHELLIMNGYFWIQDYVQSHYFLNNNHVNLSESHREVKNKNLEWYSALYSLQGGSLKKQTEFYNLSWKVRPVFDRLVLLFIEFVLIRHFLLGESH